MLLQLINYRQNNFFLFFLPFQIFTKKKIVFKIIEIILSIIHYFSNQVYYYEKYFLLIHDSYITFLGIHKHIQIMLNLKRLYVNFCNRSIIQRFWLQKFLQNKISYNIRFGQMLQGTICSGFNYFYLNNIQLFLKSSQPYFIISLIIGQIVILIIIKGLILYSDKSLASNIITKLIDMYQLFFFLII
ncbi:unnamed protein product [Paramecium sonneborni]|uniref:Transmembrane protein n=1 Tax=Paramecium sonneborni TaxID=65129 RepID=A0A8S1KGB8_9CILI|nr:unnamed protein product [Paramecium sonneborni]